MVIGLQIGMGFLNVALLAPLWMQIGHLLLADSLWILLVVITAETLTLPEEASQISLATGD
jgi:heme A synthase